MNDLKTPFGRVDSENNVYLIEGASERRVGQYPNVTPDEALAFYVKKFTELDSQVRILEQRVASGIDTHLLKKAHAKLESELIEPNAVGDLANLRLRMGALATSIKTLEDSQKEESKVAIDKSIATRQAIAEKAEKIANTDSAKIQWKSSSAEMLALFEAWQADQKAHPRVPKSLSEPIWKRFSAARTKFETAKRAHFAQLAATTKTARNARIALVAKAEKLAAKSGATTAEFKELLEEWKATGKSNGKSDEQLWLKFKSFGDAIFAAKQEQITAERAEFSENLKAKLELLVEASKIDPSKDLSAAKNQLQSIQQKWEKIGKVPREKLREIEDKLKAIEKKVKSAEDEIWRKTDPAAKARTSAVTEQLEDSIAKLELQLADSKKASDAKKTKELSEALAARKAWLEVVLASSN